MEYLSINLEIFFFNSVFDLSIIMKQSFDVHMEYKSNECWSSIVNSIIVREKFVDQT